MLLSARPCRPASLLTCQTAWNCLCWAIVFAANIGLRSCSQPAVVEDKLEKKK
jgi:hypothetical protein